MWQFPHPDLSPIEVLNNEKAVVSTDIGRGFKILVWEEPGAFLVCEWTLSEGVTRVDDQMAFGKPSTRRHALRRARQRVEKLKSHLDRYQVGYDGIARHRTALLRPETADSESQRAIPNEVEVGWAVEGEALRLVFAYDARPLHDIVLPRKLANALAEKLRSYLEAPETAPE